MDEDFFIRQGDFPRQSWPIAGESGAVWRKKYRPDGVRRLWIQVL